MAGLRETNRLRQSQIVETLRVMRDMRREMSDMQAELLAIRGQPRRARRPRGDIRVPNHQDAPRDADSIREVGYGFRDTWIDLAEAVPKIASTTLEKVNTRVTKLAEHHEQDTQDLYALLEDAQDSRTRISQRVAMDSQRVNLLMGDRMTLQETIWIVEEEAYAARKAWTQLVGLNQTAYHELQNLCEQVYAHDYQLQAHQAQLQVKSTLIQTHQQLRETHSQMQQTEMAGLRETNRLRQSQIVETLRVMRDMR
nr:hypothetical protein [Tanacetum cinerariifolium]